MSDTIEVVAVNLGARLALSSDDVVATIEAFYDADYIPTSDRSEAVFAVLRFAENRWATIRLDEFDLASLN